MKRLLLHALLAPVPFVLVGCAQNGAASASEDEDWLVRAAAIVTVSDDPEKVWDCEFVSNLTMTEGWDGELSGLTRAEEDVVRELKRAAATAGGNFVLMIPGETPRAEAYLCTE